MFEQSQKFKPSNHRTLVELPNRTELARKTDPQQDVSLPISSYTVVSYRSLSGELCTMCCCTERVSVYKHLRGGVQFIKELPRSPSGKLLRHKMIDSVLSQSRL